MIVKPSDPNSPLMAFNGEQRQPTIILLSSVALLITWKLFGTNEFYIQHFSDYPYLFGDLTTTATTYHFLSCFILWMVIPALIVKFVFKQRLADYGLQIGKPKLTFQQVFVYAPIFILVGYLASGNTDILEAYPKNKHASLSSSIFIFHTSTLLLFYIAFEFHFRGFLQVGLTKSMGITNAILIQVLASVLIHLGSPVSEIYASIFSGLLWGIISYRSQSIVGCVAQHFIIGITTDLFICYG